MRHSNSKSESFRTDIAGLRGIAVLMVTLCHFEVPGFGGGFIGPDIFFVLSGYLITGLLVKEYKSNIHHRTGMGSVSLKAFYLRRARRILPAALFVILAINVWAYFHLNSLQVSQIKSDTVWTVFFGANITFLRQAMDYFAQNNAVSPLQHYWSLSVEEQFYTVWPVLFLTAVSFTNFVFRGKTFHWQARLRVVFSIIGIASFCWLLIEFTVSPTTAYFSTFSRAWELALGGLLSMVNFSELAKKFKGQINVLRVVALITIVGALAVVTPGNFGYTLVVPAVATGFLLLSGAHTKGDFTHRLLSSRVLNALGAISFSLYLWHWPVFVFGRQEGWMETLPQRFVGIAVCLALATTTYFLIEKTFLAIPLPRPKKKNPAMVPGVSFAKSRVKTSITTLAVVAGLAAITYPSAYGFTTTNKAPSEVWVPPASAASFAPDYRPSGGVQQPIANAQNGTSASSIRTLQSEIAKGLAIRELPQKLQPELEKLSKDKEKWQGVELDCMQMRQLDTACRNGSVSSNQKPEASKVVVLGDSYAESLIPAVINAFNPKEYNLRGYILNECNVADLPNMHASGKLMPECPIFRKWAFNQIIELKPSLVILSENLGVLTSKDVPKQDALEKSLKILKKSGSQIVLLGRNTPSGNLLTCLDRDNKYTVDCFPKPKRELTEIERRAAAKTGINFIDLTPYFCSKGVCPPVIGDTIVTWDGSHPTPQYGVKLGPVLRTLILPYLS